MIVELNIESGNLGQVVRDLRKTFPGFQARIADASYDGPDGRVQVSKLVVRAVTPVGLPTVIGRVYTLAIKHNQDCIALRHTKNTLRGHEGAMLIGPNAAKWGEFNPEFFTPF